MKITLNSFSPFLEENKDFFLENKTKTISILKELILKTNHVNEQKLKAILIKFFDSIFIEVSNNSETFHFIANLNNINSILNRTFLFLANNYIKEIFKKEHSIEKLLTFTKLCDFYITYLNHYKEENTTSSKLPKEIREYFSSAKPIIYFTVFKGIPISYKTFIKNIQDDTIEVKVNSHQIISAKFQRQVYLLTPDTTKTFVANIQEIKQNEKIVVLNNISNIKRDKIKRNFIRVQPKEKIIVQIQYKDIKFHGEIYDLSLRGLAVISKPLDIAISEKVLIELNFDYGGNIDIKTKAELVSITKLNENQYKYHFYFVLSHKDEISLEKYICHREQEIINELNQYIKKSLF